MKHTLLAIFFLLQWTNSLSSQAPDHFDQSGKLGTVIACIAVILIGIVLFLFYLERRISRMEDDIVKRE